MPNRPTFAESVTPVANNRPHGFGAVPDSPDSRDFEYKAVAAAGRVVELPDSVSVGHLLPKKVWDQGRFGSCTAFTALHLVAAAWRKAGLIYQEPSFMATWYWTKAAMYGEPTARMDVGCSIREAVMSTRREGVAFADDFPYSDKTIESPPDDEVLAKAQTYQSLYFFRIDDFENGIDEDFIFRCLAEGWPVSIAVPIHEGFVPEYASSMVLDPTRGSLEGYHAMTIYGYYLEGKRPYFKVRNQWGEHWGGRHLLPSGRVVEAGCCRLPVDFVKEFGFDCWTIRQVEDGRVKEEVEL